MSFLLLFVALASPVDPILGFAQQLERENDLYRAILEYKRARFFLADDAKRFDSLSLKIARLYERLGDYTSAQTVLREVHDTLNPAWKFEMGRVYFLQNQYDQARVYWASWDTLRGWIALRRGDFKTASQIFGVFHLPPRKRPWIAATLSAFVPGLGKGYLGRWGDGIYSFLLTVGSAALAYHHFRSGHKWPTYLYGSLAAFFYAGNVYGSWIAAKEFNRVHQKRTIAMMEVTLGLWRYLP